MQLAITTRTRLYAEPEFRTSEFVICKCNVVYVAGQMRSPKKIRQWLRLAQAKCVFIFIQSSSSRVINIFISV